MKRFLRELFKKMGQDVADFYHGYGRGILYWTLAIVVGYLIMHGYVVLCIAAGTLPKGWAAIQIIGGILLLFAEVLTAIWVWKASEEVRHKIDEENKEMMSTLRGDLVGADRYRSPNKRKYQA